MNHDYWWKIRYSDITQWPTYFTYFTFCTCVKLEIKNYKKRTSRELNTSISCHTDVIYREPFDAAVENVNNTLWACDIGTWNKH